MPPVQTLWSVFKRLSWLSLLTMFAFLIAGVFAIYSATYRGEDTVNAPFWKMQAIWIGVGLLGFTAAVAIDYRQIGKWTWVLYILCVMLLCVVLVAGAERYGARSWLGIRGLGIQPSEFAKIGLAFALAYYLSDPERDVRSFMTLVICLAMLSGTVVLILLEPDLGSAAVLLPMAAAMMFVAGIPLRYYFGALLAIVMFGAVLYSNLTAYQAESQQLRQSSPDKTVYTQRLLQLNRKYILKPYQWERILVFFQSGARSLRLGLEPAAIPNRRRFGRRHRQRLAPRHTKRVGLPATAGGAERFHFLSDRRRRRVRCLRTGADRLRGAAAERALDSPGSARPPGPTARHRHHGRAVLSRFREHRHDNRPGADYRPAAAFTELWGVVRTEAPLIALGILQNIRARPNDLLTGKTKHHE